MTEAEWKLSIECSRARDDRSAMKTIYTVLSSKNYEYITEPEWNLQCSRARRDRSGMKTIQCSRARIMNTLQNQSEICSVLEEELSAPYDRSGKKTINTVFSTRAKRRYHISGHKTIYTVLSRKNISNIWHNRNETYLCSRARTIGTNCKTIVSLL